MRCSLTWSVHPAACWIKSVVPVQQVKHPVGLATTLCLLLVALAHLQKQDCVTNIVAKFSGTCAAACQADPRGESWAVASRTGQPQTASSQSNPLIFACGMHLKHYSACNLDLFECNKCERMAHQV